MKCSICEEKLDEIYDNPDGGVKIQCVGHYGSSYDGVVATGIVCDNCFGKMIKLLEVIKNHCYL
jgi:hypothetical protein